MTRKPLGNWHDRGVWLLLAVCAGLLLTGARLRLDLARVPATILLSPLRGTAALVRVLRASQSDNRRLSELAAELAVENARLRALAEPTPESPRSKLPLVRAAVIVRSLGAFDRFLVIGQGGRSGLRVGLPAITGDGLVGKLISVGPHQSLVQTLLASDSRVAVMNARTRVSAVARPGRGGLLSLEYVPKEADFAVGDTMISAGIGGVYPEGIRVGTAVLVPDEPEVLFRHVMVRPFVDLTRLEQLFVLILPEGPDAEAGSTWLDNTRPLEVTVPEDEAP